MQIVAKNHFLKAVKYHLACLDISDMTFSEILQDLEQRNAFFCQRTVHLGVLKRERVFVSKILNSLNLYALTLVKMRTEKS